MIYEILNVLKIRENWLTINEMLEILMERKSELQLYEINKDNIKFHIEKYIDRSIYPFIMKKGDKYRFWSEKDENKVLKIMQLFEQEIDIKQIMDVINKWSAIKNFKEKDIINLLRFYIENGASIDKNGSVIFEAKNNVFLKIKENEIKNIITKIDKMSGLLNIIKQFDEFFVKNYQVCFISLPHNIKHIKLLTKFKEKESESVNVHEANQETKEKHRKETIVDNQIGNEFYKKFNNVLSQIGIEELRIATGYLFESGIRMFEYNLIAFLKNKINVKLIIGSLQHYNKYESEYSNNLPTKKIKTMNKNTAVKLNDLIELGLQIKTKSERFFHGKIYICQGKNKDILIIGSTNISRTGMSESIEINNMIEYEKNDERFLKWVDWYENFYMSCEEISGLNEELFETNEFDPVNNNGEWDTVKIDHIKEKTAIKKEEAVKYIYEDLDNKEISRRIQRLEEQKNIIKRYIFSDEPRYHKYNQHGYGVSKSKGFNNYILFVYKNTKGNEKLALEALEKESAFYTLDNINSHEKLLYHIQHSSKAEFKQLYSNFLNIKHHNETIDQRLNKFFKQ